MERTYTIPLRKAYLKAPIYLRTNRAVREVKMYLQRHMKTTDVRLGEELNKSLWTRGDSKPPHHVTVVVKMEEKTAYAELAGKEFAKKNFSQETEEKPKKETRGVDEAALKAAADVKPAAKKAEPKEAAKEEKPAAKKAPAKKAAKK
jgi:large subunit ribosomal protein L31e